MVASMRPGSVIMDLAGETGGNCALSEPRPEVIDVARRHGGRPLAPPLELPWHASEMFGRNVTELLQHLVHDGALAAGLRRRDHRAPWQSPVLPPLPKEPPPMGEWMLGLYVFVLAMLVGFEVITKVPPTLHTPLMSGANAISGITLLGALLVAGAGGSGRLGGLAIGAVVLATVNVVGGFLVTDRMLRMFRKRD
jgi:H+-translocating NAD(P) transhydrogenase subunit alpha